MKGTSMRLLINTIDFFAFSIKRSEFPFNDIIFSPDCFSDIVQEDIPKIIKFMTKNANFLKNFIKLFNFNSLLKYITDQISCEYIYFNVTNEFSLANLVLP